MYEVSIRGMVTTPEGSHGVDGGQLKADIEARRDIFSEGSVEEGERIDVFVPYHAVETAQLRWSALEAADPVDANCLEDEPSGTVLYDGTVTLAYDEDEGGYIGEIEPLESVADGRLYTVTLNGNAVTCLASADDTGFAIASVGIHIESGDGVTLINFVDAQEGENTLVISEAVSGIYPSQIVVGIGGSELVHTVGSVESFESSDTSVATVEMFATGQYVVTGMAIGTSTITFLIDGQTFTLDVTVVNIA